MKLLFQIALVLFMSPLFAQATVKVAVSADTVAMGDLVELTYTIENGQGKFVPPDLSKLPVVSGPNTSSSMMYQNGKMSSSQSYNYILRPDIKGTIQIPAASYTNESDTIHIEPLTIVVSAYGPVSPPFNMPQENKPTTPVREKKKF